MSDAHLAVGDHVAGLISGLDRPDDACAANEALARHPGSIG